MFVRTHLLNPKRTLCKTRALDLSNQAITTYICKPAVVQYSNKRKLMPSLCKLVYIQCDNNELCKIAELELPSAPPITYLIEEKNEK